MTGKFQSEKSDNHSWKAVVLLALLCLFAMLPAKRAKANSAEMSSKAASETETAAPIADLTGLPPLIQSTSIEEDHRTRLRLDLTGTVRIPEADMKQAWEKVLSSCVRIQGNGHHGSGSIYGMTEREVVIVTNRHVLQYWDEDSYITFMNGISTSGRLLWMSDTADVGFVTASVEDIGYELLWFLHTVRPLEPGAEEGLKEGTSYFAVNMASDWQNPVCCEGTVVDARIWLEEFQMPMLLGRGMAVPGMSGGGIFDAYGNYLGMITGGNEEEMTAVLPVSEIAAAYEQIKG